MWAEILYAAFHTKKNFIHLRNVADIVKTSADWYITEVFPNWDLNI